MLQGKPVPALPPAPPDPAKLPPLADGLPVVVPGDPPCEASTEPAIAASAGALVAVAPLPPEPPEPPAPTARLLPPEELRPPPRLEEVAAGLAAGR